MPDYNQLARYAADGAKSLGYVVAKNNIRNDRYLWQSVTSLIALAVQDPTTYDTPETAFWCAWGFDKLGDKWNLGDSELGVAATTVTREFCYITALQFYKIYYEQEPAGIFSVQAKMLAAKIEMEKRFW